MISRRRLIGSLGVAGGGALLAGCDRIAATPFMRGVFGEAERLSWDASRMVAPRGALAPEFAPADISPVFRGNGVTDPATPAYAASAAAGFGDWRLTIDGLVRHPQSLSLADLHALPARTQITRHDCVEGWSAIGQWTGTPLALLLRRAGLLRQARFVLFECADRWGDGHYYESIDLADAFHPQTIMAWGLNGRALPVANGAPLRLRVERQLGYKHAKYVHRIVAVASLAAFGAGKGGYWEDSNDYAWFAGI